MSLERAKAYLEAKGYADHIIIPEHSSATVAEAAEALGCEPGMIAKTLSFLQDGQPVLILAEGMARIDNGKYKARFGCKAKMIPGAQVEELIGHVMDQYEGIIVEAFRQGLKFGIELMTNLKQ